MSPEISLAEDKVIKTISEATGIPREEVCGLMMSDQDLDQLCDAILSRFAAPPKTTGLPKTSRVGLMPMARPAP